MSGTQLPIELQRDLDKALQYLIYNCRQAILVELQLKGVDPTPYMDGTTGYVLQFVYKRCDMHGFEAVASAVAAEYDESVDLSVFGESGE